MLYGPVSFYFESNAIFTNACIKFFAYSDKFAHFTPLNHLLTEYSWYVLKSGAVFCLIIMSKIKSNLDAAL